MYTNPMDECFVSSPLSCSPNNFLAIIFYPQKGGLECFQKNDKKKYCKLNRIEFQIYIMPWFHHFQTYFFKGNEELKTIEDDPKRSIITEKVDETTTEDPTGTTVPEPLNDPSAGGGDTTDTPAPPQPLGGGGSDPQGNNDSYVIVETRDKPQTEKEDVNDAYIIVETRDINDSFEEDVIPAEASEIRKTVEPAPLTVNHTAYIVVETKDDPEISTNFNKVLSNDRNKQIEFVPKDVITEDQPHHIVPKKGPNKLLIGRI